MSVDLLDVVMKECGHPRAALGEDEALLIGMPLVLDLLLHVVDGVRRLDVGVIALPVRVLTKICIASARTRGLRAAGGDARSVHEARDFLE